MSLKCLEILLIILLTLQKVKHNGKIVDIYNRIVELVLETVYKFDVTDKFKLHVIIKSLMNFC